MPNVAHKLYWEIVGAGFGVGAAVGAADYLKQANSDLFLTTRPAPSKARPLPAAAQDRGSGL